MPIEASADALGPTSTWHWQLVFVLVVFFYPLFPWLVFSCRWCSQAFKTALLIVPLYPVMIVLQFGGLFAALSAQGAVHDYFTLVLLLLIMCGVITMVICIDTTLRHLNGWVIEATEQEVVYILALPAFFNVMSIRSGYLFLDYKFGAVTKHWCDSACGMSSGDVKAFTEDMSDLYFATAGVFEAIALKCFGQLVMRCIRSVRQVSTIESLTMLPVYSYCLVLISESCYHLVYVLVKHFNMFLYVYKNSSESWQNWLDKMLSMDQFREATHWFFMGAKNLGIFVAVSGLLIVEKTFHKELAAVGFILEGREPPRRCSRIVSFFWRLIESKFMGVKIVVTLETVSYSVVVVCASLFAMSATMQGLLYAGLISAGCIFVAWIHTVAYVPGCDWLQESQRTFEEEGAIELSSGTSWLRPLSPRGSREVEQPGGALQHRFSPRGAREVAQSGGALQRPVSPRGSSEQPDGDLELRFSTSSCSWPRPISPRRSKHPKPLDRRRSDGDVHLVLAAAK